MPPSVNKSNAKHLRKSKAVTDYHEFPAARIGPARATAAIRMPGPCSYHTSTSQRHRGRRGSSHPNGVAAGSVADVRGLAPARCRVPRNVGAPVPFRPRPRTTARPPTAGRALTRTLLLSGGGARGGVCLGTHGS